MKKVFLILASAVALAAPMALADETVSSYGLSPEETMRFEAAGQKVQKLVEANAPPEEIAAAAAEVQKIYDELRAKSEAEAARFRALGQGGE